MNNVITSISQKAQSIDYNKQLKNAGEYIMDKKEKIENSETFKGFMSAISSGINSIVRKTEDFFNDSLDSNLYNVNNENSQQRRNANRFDNSNMNQNQFQGQIPYNNSNMNNFVPSENINSNNDNNINFNVNGIDLNRETPEGDVDIPSLIEYSNNNQNINVEGENKSNDNTVENLDQNNDNKKP